MDKENAATNMTALLTLDLTRVHARIDEVTENNKNLVDLDLLRRELSALVTIRSAQVVH